MKLKQLLYEAGIFDKYAFAENPKISKAVYSGKIEKNNEIEQDIYDAIKSWTANSEDEPLYNLIDDYGDTLIKQYPEIFKPKTPNGTTLYSGIGYPSQQLKNIIGKSRKEDWTQSTIIKDAYQFIKPIKYNPKSGKQIQSWTTNINVANEFANGIVLQIEQNSEFFMNSDVLYYIYEDTDENEILHIGTTYKNPIYITISKNWYNFKFNKSSPTSSIEKILHKLRVKNPYTINDDGSVDVDGWVDISGLGLTKIPIKFGKVNGSFNCGNNKLKNLENSPDYVKNFFNCSMNPPLTTLKGVENMIVNGDFECSFNKNLKSLDYLPKKVGGKVINFKSPFE